MLCISLSHHPTAEPCAQCQCDLWAPLIERLTLNHVPELRPLDPQLVDRLFELLKLLINHVHDVLLTLCRINQVLIVLVVAQVVAIRKDAGFDISRHSQHTILLQSQESFLRITLSLLLGSIEEMDLKLWPSCLDIQTVDFFTE